MKSPLTSWRKGIAVLTALLIALVMFFVTAPTANADTGIANPALTLPNWSGSGTSLWNTDGGYGTATAGDNNTAVLTGDGANGGPYTWFGAGDGGRTTWTGNWETDTSVYLDPSWPNGTGFDYSVADNGGRDFIFHIGEENGQLEVSASNNSNDSSVDPSEFSSGYTQVTTAGTYDLQQVFKNVNGQVVVDFNLIDSAGNTTLVDQIVSPDAVANVGGNSYGWFTFITVPGGVQVGTVSYSSLTQAVVTDGSGNALGYYDTVPAAASAAVSGDIIQVVPGTYQESGIELTQPDVTLEGNGAILQVPDGTNGVTITANDVTVEGLNFEGPAYGQSYLTYNWGSTVSRGGVVSRGVNNFTFTSNTFEGLRNDLLIDGRGDSGSVVNNEIGDSKSGVSVQYTAAQNINLAGNTQGPFGNEWGLNLHLNGYASDPYDADAQPVSNPALGAADPDAQANIKALSAANGNWAVFDQTYTSANRTVDTADASGSPTGQGDPLGPISNPQTAVDDVVSGGVVNFTSDFTVTSELAIENSVTINGNGHTISPAFDYTDSLHNSVIGISVQDANHPNVTINDLTVDGTGGTGLQGINTSNGATVALNGVTSKNNAKSGVNVNGATVTAHDLTTSGNGWDGVDVDHGTAGQPASFTLTGDSTLGDSPAVLVDNPSPYDTVSLPAGQYVDNPEGVYNVPAAPTSTATGDQFQQSEDGSAATGTTPVELTGTAPSGTNEQVEADIPADTVITPAQSGWDGVVAAPTVVTTPVSTPAGTTQAVVISVGSSDTELDFSQGVKLVIPGQAGKSVGYQEPGGAFTPITNVCSADNANSVSPSGITECAISVGSDLVVWTTHFTTFATYAATPPPSGGSGGSTPPALTLVTPSAPAVTVPATCTNPSETVSAPAQPGVVSSPMNLTLAASQSGSITEVPATGYVFPSSGPDPSDTSTSWTWSYTNTPDPSCVTKPPVKKHPTVSIHFTGNGTTAVIRPYNGQSTVAAIFRVTWVTAKGVHKTRYVKIGAGNKTGLPIKLKGLKRGSFVKVFAFGKQLRSTKVPLKH